MTFDLARVKKRHLTWGCLENTRFSPGRLFGRHSPVFPLPYIIWQGGTSAPSDAPRLRLSCEAIGCFVLSGELCGCWKAAVKARECLRLQATPGSGGQHTASHPPVGDPPTSSTLPRVPFQPAVGRDERFQAARSQQIKTVLEGE